MQSWYMKYRLDLIRNRPKVSILHPEDTPLPIEDRGFESCCVLMDAINTQLDVMTSKYNTMVELINMDT